MSWLVDRTQCIVWDCKHPVDFQLQICHPTFYELAALQLTFEFYHQRKHVLFTKYQCSSTIIWSVNKNNWTIFFSLMLCQRDVCSNMKRGNCLVVVELYIFPGYLWDVVITKIVQIFVFFPPKLRSVLFTHMYCLNTCTVEWSELGHWCELRYWCELGWSDRCLVWLLKPFKIQ